MTTVDIKTEIKQWYGDRTQRAVAILESTNGFQWGSVEIPISAIDELIKLLENIKMENLDIKIKNKILHKGFYHSWCGLMNSGNITKDSSKVTCDECIVKIKLIKKKENEQIKWD